LSLCQIEIIPLVFLVEVLLEVVIIKFDLFVPVSELGLGVVSVSNTVVMHRLYLSGYQTY